MGNLEKPISIREMLIAVIIGISIAIAMLLIIWAQEPEPPLYRPLVQDIRLQDSVKIADVLEQNKIRYKTDIRSHMMFVLMEDNLRARVALARAGIEIDYPSVIPQLELAEVCGDVLPDLQNKAIEVPLWEQPWAMRALKLVMGGLIIIILILAIVRPMLKELIYPNDSSDK